MWRHRGTQRQRSAASGRIAFPRFSCRVRMRPSGFLPSPPSAGGEGSGVRGVGLCSDPPPHPQPLSPADGEWGARTGHPVPDRVSGSAARCRRRGDTGLLFSPRRSAMTVAFQKVIPILRIFGVAKAKEFYVDYLRFSVDWEHHFEENTPAYIQLSRDGLVLHLSEHHGDGGLG